MTQWHLRSRRKISGGMRTTIRAEDRKLRSMGGNPAHTIVSAGEPKREAKKGMGSTRKVKLKRDRFVFAVDGKKVKRLEITAVEENKADRQFTRRNIITKGAVLKALDGQKEVFVRVTSRPGQSGSIMGKILESFETHQEKKAKKKEKKEAEHRNAKEEKKHEKPSMKAETAQNPEKAVETQEK